MNSNNPVTWGAAIIGFTTSGIGLVTAFGLSLSERQSGAILAFVGQLIVLSGFILHNKVISKGQANDKITEAWIASPGTAESEKPKA